MNQNVEFKKLSIAATAALGVALLAANPVAVQAAGQNAQIEARFKAADKDADGKLTLEEAKAGMPRIAANFDKIDSDKKGYLTLEQIEAVAANH